ncbi:MAG: class I SAM-dependent methyltransferase [Caldilineaceae bacterium]|nr:class I SAM-dependent methyltransferase [Caldilineaceae bacterium]
MTAHSTDPNTAESTEMDRQVLQDEQSADEANDLEHRYYRYLRAQSYITEDALLEVLRCYLPYFADFAHVLDIGCGHGEFLQLLQDAGHEAVGIDIDPAMVESCHAKGLTAVEGDAIAWLATQEQAFDAIFSSNVIEHMDAGSVQSLIHHAYRALRPGGMLLLGTPNPESLIVQFHEFWRDPTHVRLYHRQLLEFFFADAGFTEIANGNNAAAAWEGIDWMVDPARHPAMATEQLRDLLPPPPEATLGELHPLPQPPAPSAGLRQRLAYRVLQVVYQKFLEPYVALLRHDLAQQRHYSRLLQEQVSQLRESNRQLIDTLQATIQQQEARFRQTGEGVRFLYPPRELFVYGYKPAAAAPEEPSATVRPSAPTTLDQQG